MNKFFKKHRKGFAVAFVVSLLPCLKLLYDFVYAYFNGTTLTASSTVYGTHAIEYVFGSLLMSFGWFGIIPLCFVYQMVFLILYCNNKK